MIRRKPKRSRVTKSGRVILDKVQMGFLRLEVYYRAEGQCENAVLVPKTGNNHKPQLRRCKNEMRWEDGHLHHRIHRSLGGSDSYENCFWLCASCHENEHSGKRKFVPWKEPESDTD